MKKIGLLGKIIIAIILGVTIGSFSPEWIIRIGATFNELFGNFLSFMIPFIIIGFIAPGIGAMGRGAGKLLGLTGIIAYVSTVISGVIAYFVATVLYPTLLKGQSITTLADPSEGLSTTYLELEMPPLMDVMTALLIAFVIGLGMAAIKGNALLNIMDEFQEIVQLVIKKVIIPLLPFHIFGIFANMTYAGQVTTILSVFVKVFIMIILLHIFILIVQYTAAGSISKQNPLTMLRRMMPAYFTALGTQSSAATIPVTLERTKSLKVRESIANFTIPLLATIHLSGSTITIVSCALAVLFLQGSTISFGMALYFILLVGVTMVAAPGIPKEI